VQGPWAFVYESVHWVEGESPAAALQAGVRLRYASRSTAITPGEYVQAQDGWVALLRGEAVLDLANKTAGLGAGDWLFIPAGTPHTARRVFDGAIWLVVHLHTPLPVVPVPEPPGGEPPTMNPDDVHGCAPREAQPQAAALPRIVYPGTTSIAGRGGPPQSRAM